MLSNSHVLYLSHGGGPMPLLGDRDHSEMVANLQLLAKKVGKPSAVLVISAHWEADVPTMTCSKNPPLIYDYLGFPRQAYDIQYPCSGAPELSNQVYNAFKRHGLEVCKDGTRGFDHGVFVPLSIMYPKADVPCVQLSLVDNLNPEQHLQMGRVLQDLDWSNLLVIGSGSSFHNMRAFFVRGNREIESKNQAFQDWLRVTLSDTTLTELERARRLKNWEDAPFAIFCHPREEHLLPLHICYGVAGKACTEHQQLNIMGKASSMFAWLI